MSYHWPADTVFHELTLEVEDRTCWQCAQALTICCHRQRRFFTCDGPVQLLSKLRHCSNPQIRDELADRFAIPLSVDAIERYISRYQRMVAARHQYPVSWSAAY